MYTSLNDVVNSINGIYGESAEEQAAHYVWDAVIDSGEDLTEALAEYHLDVLVNAGAVFNYSIAKGYIRYV